MLTLPTAVLLLATPYWSERYVMRVGGVPVGAINIRTDGGGYHYESVQLFNGAARVRKVRLDIDAKGLLPSGHVPEVALLRRRPAPGCYDVQEELTGKEEVVCINAYDGRLAHGAIDTTSFDAWYSPTGALLTLTMDAVVFEASTAVLEAGVNPFEAGIPLSAVKLQKAWKAVRPIATGDGKGDARCLDVAKAAVDKEPALKVVLGLVIEDERVWPHAWVRRGARHEDPSVPKGEPLSSRRYLELPTGNAGQVYLQLLSGRAAKP